MDPRIRRRDEQRSHVVAVAFNLFDDQGYEATTVEEIAGSAGISTRTFYRYFESKDGVLSDLGSTVIDDLLEQFGQRDGPVSISALTRALTRVLGESMTSRRGELFVSLLREVPELQDRAGRWREQWASQLAHGLAEHAGRQEPTYEEHVISRMAISIVAVALDCWLQEGDAAGTMTDTVEEALTVIRRRLDDAAG